jgi:hypothetical protein
MDTDKILYRAQSESIIGCSMKVLKPGLSEKAYENSLVIELRHLVIPSNNRNVSM